MNLRRSTANQNLASIVANGVVSAAGNVLDENSFHRMISLERKRTERSRTPFLLVQLDMGSQLLSEKNGNILAKIVSTLCSTIRETDVTGWYKNNSVVGIMFTQIAFDDRYSVMGTIMARVSHTLRHALSLQQFNQISISFHLYPDEWDPQLPDRPSNPTLYPDLSRRDESRKLLCALKRIMDIAGSVLALTFFSPLFLAITVAIKLTSTGPVFFRQRRLGRYGTPFVFLKFRSMCVNSDSTIHKEYVRQLIAGCAERNPSNGNGRDVYKLTKDPRVTALGNLLRRSSLDELPQFINVLKGEMSLVGPRPPIVYEVEAYDLWHRRRTLEAKPGITGLWQVNGRNRIPFDEMVRLDIAYAKTWSPWLDIKILLRTPRAILEGAH